MPIPLKLGSQGRLAQLGSAESLEVDSLEPRVTTVDLDIGFGLTGGAEVVLGNSTHASRVLGELHADDFLQFADISAPGSPADNFGRLFKKTGDDGIFWLPDSAGAEVDLTDNDTGLVFSTGVAKTAFYVIPFGEIVKVDPSGGTVVVEPTSSPSENDRLGMKNVTSSTNSITFDADGGLETVDGQISTFMIGPYECQIYQYNGTEWNLVADAFVPAAASDTLQTAYAAGNVIAVTDADGAVALSTAAAVTVPALDIDMNATGSGAFGIHLDMDAAATGAALRIDLAAATTGHAIDIRTGAGFNAGGLLSVQTNVSDSMLLLEGSGQVTLSAVNNQSLQMTAAGTGTLLVGQLGTGPAGVQALGASIFMLPNDDGTIQLGNSVLIANQTDVGAHTYPLLNFAYETDTGITGGIVVNNEAETPLTTDTVAGAYTASPPAVTTVLSNTFSVGDIVMIFGGSTLNNNGLFEVLTHIGTALVFKGTGGTAKTEDFTRNQMIALPNDTAKIVHVKVAVIRADASGDWEVAQGSAAPLTYTPLATSDNLNLQEAYNGGSTINVVNNAVEMSNSSDATDVLNINRTFAGGGRAIYVGMGVGNEAVTGNGLRIESGTGATGAMLFVDNLGSGNALQIQDGSTDVLAVTGAGAIILSPTTGQAALTNIVGASGRWAIQDGGTDVLSMSDVGQVVIAPTTNADLDIDTLGTGAIDLATINGALSLSTGGSGDIILNASGTGALTMDTDSGNIAVTAGGSGTLALVASGATASLDSDTVGSVQLRINGAAKLTLSSAGAVDINPTSGQNASITTLTTGDIVLNSADVLTLDATNGISIDAGAASNFSTSAGILTIDAAAAELQLSHGGGVTRVLGDLIVDGTTFSVNSETVLIADNHLYLNAGYTAASAETGGLVVNYLPTATVDTVTGTAFTSATQVTTTAAATFTAGDLIQISGANTEANNGLYEVQTHTGNVLTIDSTPQDDFTQTAFVADATAGSTSITKVGVSVLQAGPDGIWETAVGSTAGLSFTDLGSAGGNSLQAAYVQGSTIAVTTAKGIKYSNAVDLTDLFELERTFVGAGHALLVDMGPGNEAVTGDGIHIQSGTAATGTMLSIVNSGVGDLVDFADVTDGTIFKIDAAGAVTVSPGTGQTELHTVDGAAVEFDLVNAAAAFRIRNDGGGTPVFEVDAAGSMTLRPTSGVGFDLEVTNSDLTLSALGTGGLLVSSSTQLDLEAGATDDIALDARGGSITVNQSADVNLGQTAATEVLNGATSIVGAVNRIARSIDIDGRGPTKEYVITGVVVIAAGDVISVSGTTGQIELFDATTSTRFVGIALTAGTGNGSATVRVALPGSYVTDSGLGATVGDALYGPAVAGGPSTTAPSVTGDVLQRIGYAISATQYVIDPGPAFIL